MPWGNKARRGTKSARKSRMDLSCHCLVMVAYTGAGAWDNRMGLNVAASIISIIVMVKVV